jgi:hypothetical protein
LGGFQGQAVTSAEQMWRDAFGGLLEGEGAARLDERSEQGEAEEQEQAEHDWQEYWGAIPKGQALPTGGAAACQRVGAALQPQVGAGSMGLPPNLILLLCFTDWPWCTATMLLAAIHQGSDAALDGTHLAKHWASANLNL